MTPTRIRLLLAIAGLLGVAGWIAVTVADQAFGRLLQVPLAASAALALMAAALLVWGLVARPRLQKRSGAPPLDPIVAARTAALALAASRTGAAVLGFYAGIAVGLLPSLSTPAGREYAVAAAAASLASLLLTAAGLWVESLCRLRGDDDGSAPGAPPAKGQASSEAARTAS